MDMKLRHLSGTVFIVLVIMMMIYLVMTKVASEGFVDAGRCGVDLPSCQGERIRCMNGYCKSDIPPRCPCTIRFTNDTSNKVSICLKIKDI
jgi:hypothetical protein